MRRSVSEAALTQPEGPLGTDSLKGLKLHDLSLRNSCETPDTPELSLSAETIRASTPSTVNFLLGSEDRSEVSEGPEELSNKDRVRGVGAAFPEGFHPRRCSQGAMWMPLYSAPIVKNPFMSPLLAPDSMLQTLPPVHIVVSARPGRWSRRGGGRVGAWGAWGKELPGSQVGGKGESAAAGRGCQQEGRPGNEWIEGVRVASLLLQSY